MHEPPLWLFIDFPRLALEAAFPPDADPDQARLLIAPDGRSVRLCNPAAEAVGIRSGMALRTAYWLVERVDLAGYDPGCETEHLRRLALLCYRLCAGVRLCPPSGLCLEVGSMLRLYRGLPPLLAALEQQLDGSRHQYRLALGHTPLAARLLAENDHPWRQRDRQGENRLLDGLNVACLALPLAARDVQALAAMGLKTLGALRQAPRAELGYRFGQGLVDHLAALERPRELGEPFRLPPRFNERLELWHEVASAERLVFPVRRLLQSLEAYLDARQLAAGELLLRLEHREARPTRLSVQAPGGSRDIAHWQSLVALALERQSLPEAVVGLRLQARHFQDDAGQPGDLLGDARPLADADHLRTLVVSKLGVDRVHRPAAGPDLRPLVASQPRPALEQIPDNEVPCPRAQPSLLLECPERIDPGDYRLEAGPERLALGRWVQPGVFQRDYFRAWHTATGQHHWLSRDRDGQWYLEGLFA